MDIKAEIEKVVNSITKDNALKDKFTKDPAGTVKGLLGNLPDGTVDSIVTGVKAKLAGTKLAGAADALGGLFGK